jgi:hypothetical protein
MYVPGTEESARNTIINRVPALMVLKVQLGNQMMRGLFF